MKLEKFFSPSSVAVVGASRTAGKVGHDVLQNLIESGFQGQLYPINPKADEVIDLPCYPDLPAVGEPIDLAIVVIPAKYVPDVIDQCGEVGVEAVIVISAGFKESGEEGARLEDEVAERCRKHGIRCIGPNCLGVISPPSGLNASFSGTTPPEGNVAFFSQSGALGTAVLDWFAGTEGQNLGISRFISYGNKADVDESDLIEALGEDDATEVILGYVESIEDGQKFMEIARKVTRQKPVLILKSGRTSAGARAASSHTGSLAGSDSAYEAAFQQSGVIRARDVTQFFDYVLAFSRQPAARGPNVSIVTNAGGPGILATDAIETSTLTMTELNSETESVLTENLPGGANVHNPVDVIGDARADRYRMAMDAVLEDENTDSLLVILTPQTSTEVEKTAEAIGDASAEWDKPVLATFMGSLAAVKGRDVLKERKVPNYPHPERAVRTLDAMLCFHQWRERKPEEPASFDFDGPAIEDVLQEAQEHGMNELGERFAQRVVAACGIKPPRSVLARDREEAVEALEEIGPPVVMKISSEDIIHKSDAGGVKLGIQTPDETRAAYDAIMNAARDYDPDASVEGVLLQQMVKGGTEVIVGVNRDPQFGPLVMFGLGGIYVELLKDVAFRVAPLTRRDAREMIEEIQSARILRGFRGEAPRDVEALTDCILRISQLAVSYPQLAECDINPLVLFEEGQGAVALDARFRIASV
ncbi:MAG: acetate--CoA ligase family protein [Planctomycetes bacterium]|nr:acetate--CoA ligase family protein [Planctomycetota bacterium]